MIRYFLILCLICGVAYVYIEAVGEIDIANQVTETMMRKAYYAACMESTTLPRDQADGWCQYRIKIFMENADIARETERIRVLQEINQTSPF
jgi:hypothetical protein